MGRLDELFADEVAPQRSKLDELFGDTQPVQKTGALRTLGDAGLTAVKSAIGLSEVAVGIADMQTGGYAGKAAEAIGYRPKEAKAMLDEWYSPEKKAKQAVVDQAEGFWDTAGAYARNPSILAHTVGESLGPMGGGAVIARGALKLAPKLAPFVAGAIGEGAIGMGSAAEHLRQNSEDGLLSGKQALSAAGSGVVTGALGALGGKIANKYDLGDVDTMLASGAVGASKKGVVRQTLESGLSEGVLEELPQSMQEQMWQNYATGKPLMEGVAKAGASGMMAGVAMGGVAGGVRGAVGRNVDPQNVPDALQPQDLIGLPAPGRTVGTGTSSGDILQGESSRENAYGVNEAYAEYVQAQRNAEEQRRNSAWAQYGDEYNNIDVMGNRTAPAPTGDGSQAIAIPTQGAGAAAHADHFEHPIVRAVSIITQAARAARHGTPVEGQFAEDLVWADAALRAEVGEEGYAGIVSRAAAEAAQAPKPKGKAAKQPATVTPESPAPGAVIQPTAHPVAPAVPSIITERGMEKAPKIQRDAAIAAAAAFHANEITEHQFDTYMDGIGQVRSRDKLAKALEAAKKESATEIAATKMTDDEKSAAGWTKRYTNVTEHGTVDESVFQWVPPSQKAGKAAGVRTTENAKTDPDEIEDPHEAEAVKMFDAGASMREIGAFLDLPGAQSVSNLLVKHGRVHADREAEAAAEAETRDPFTSDAAVTEGAAEAVRDLDEGDAAVGDVDMGSSTDEIVDHSNEQQGITISARKNSGAATAATADRKTELALSAALRRFPTDLKRRVDGEIRTLGGKVGPEGLLHLRTVAHKENRSLTKADIEYAQDLREALAAPKEESKLTAARKAEVEAAKLAVDYAKVAGMAEELLKGNNTVAVEMLQVLGGEHKNRLMKWLQDNFTHMPHTVVTPKATVEYLMGTGVDLQEQSAKEEALALAHGQSTWNDDTTWDRLSRESQLDFSNAVEQYSYNDSMVSHIKESFNAELQGTDASSAERTGGAATRLSEDDAVGVQDGGVEGARSPSAGKSPTVVTKKRRVAAQPDDGQISEIDVKHSVAPDALAAETAAWKNVVSAYAEGTLDRTKVLEVLSSSPAVMQALGMENLPVRGSVHMLDAQYNHGITLAQLEAIPAELANPQLVYADKGADPSINFVTTLMNNGEPVIVALRPNRDMREGKAHYVATITQKSHGVVLGAVRGGNALYVGETPMVGLKEAVQYAKQKNGRAASELRAAIAERYKLNDLKSRVLYKSDVVKLLTEGKAAFSTGTRTQGQTVTTLTAKVLKAFYSPYFFNRAVAVIQTDDALPTGLQSSDGVVQAVYDPKNNKVWMVAGNIAEGQELAVLLHEVGVHMGMKNLLGPENYAKLLKQVKQWAENGQGQEGEIARAALARVQNAEAKVGAQAEDELLAYFVEAAVNAGVDPTVLKDVSSPLAKFLVAVVRAINAALTKLGIKAETLTAQNVVDLAYGAAHMEFTAADSAPSQDAPKFSVAADVAQSFNEFKKSGLMTTLGDLWGRTKPALLTAHQMVDQFGDKLKTLRDRSQTIGDMEKMQNDIVQAVHKVAMQWQSLKKVPREKLHRIMMDATMWSIHPDQEFMKGGNAHLTEKDRANYDDLKARFDALDDKAKDVYRDARNVLAENWEMRRQVFDEVTMGAYEKRIEEAATPEKADKLTEERDKLIREHTEQIKSMKGPYFPLMRFGSYLSISMSKKLAGLTAQLEDATGDSHAALTKQINELKKQATHYVVEAFDSKAAAQKASAQHIARGMESYPQLAEKHFAHNRSIQNVAQLTHAMTHGLEAADAAKIKEKIAYLYVAGMPEHAALQRQLKRVGVEGATTDMLRAFAEAGKTDSFFLSRMKYAGEMTDQLFRIKREAKASRDLNLQHVAQVLEKHVELDMTYDDTWFQNGVNRISGIWHLAMSPAYLLTNASQPWFITAPMMAGKFNSVPKTTAALWRGWVDAKQAILMSKKDGKWLADFDITQLPKDVQDVVQFVADQGQIAINQLADTGLLSGDTNPAFAKAQMYINLPNAVIETSNRLTTTIAAYRMAIAHHMTDQQAKEYALKMVVDTQLDYTGSNTALAMRQNGLLKHMPVKMMMQFRKYQQGMVYLVVELLRKSKADPEARRQLGYLFAMQGAFAGAAGIPLVMTPVAIMSLFMGGGDDEEGDLETQMRNALTDMFGADAARAVWKGLPAAFGLDISKRVGMGSLFDPLPFTRLHDVSAARTGQEAMGKIATGVMGAGVGTMASALDSTKMFEQGDFAKGFEKLLPKALADLIKAGRYGAEGMTTRRGDEVIPAEQFGMADLALRAAGFTPTMETEHYEAQQSKEDVKAAIQQRRAQTIRDMVDARKAGDHATAMEAMREFNEAHPGKEFRITVATALKSEQAKRKVKRDEAGIAWTKNERALRGITRYAD